ncbi:DUF4328 domain-containing protein [Kribbella sp. CA-253562]|uniref:DUF4328 domain-containing protein n=1 Tax=Kribbella sp. CA-253562 TaxID=3239942 RepID=UPI003D8F48A4
MSQPYPGQGPYPGSHPQNVGQFPGGPPSPPAKYRPLRRLALVAVALMAGTAVVSVVQTILLWNSYEDVKRLVYGLLSEDEFERGAEAVVGAGPLLDMLGYLFAAAGIVVVIWLWQARENTEILKPPFAATYQGGYGSGHGAHRHSSGWTVGAWLCPVVQFWYPLQIVEDIVRASEPPNQPGVARSGGIRGLLYGWWAAWVGFCVVAVGGGLFAVISFVTWLVRLVDRADAARATGDYVDIYDLQDYLVRLALGVNIAFTVGTVLLITAGITFALLLLRISSWHDERSPQSGVPLGPTLPANSPSYLPPRDSTPQYAPRPGQALPTPGGPRPQDGAGPGYPGAGAPGGQGPGFYGPGGYQPPASGAQPPRPAGPYGPGGYGGTTGSSPNGPGPTRPNDTVPPAPRAEPPRSPWPTRESGPPEYPAGSR